MPSERTAGKPTTRRYSQEEKAAAVRMVRTLRAALGHDHGVVKRVADQLGPGAESVRLWVRQADGLLQHLVDAGSFNVPRYGTSVGSGLVADARQACGTPSDDGPECGRDHASW
ncbi:hypothetical protein HDA37_004595 [Pseudonocardia antarctica]|uniref:Transposase n=1 Tax=Pseudonocardia alni TaxID=33907 RepID=A0A852W701_PSEA5|nr:hypothetical protein [Pseudonocardia antarctica]